MKFIFKFFLFWILIFCLIRIGFIFYCSQEFAFHKWLSIEFLLASIRFDLSTISYFFIASIITYPKKLRFLFKYLQFLLFFISILIAGIDMMLYKEWFARINPRVFGYIVHPLEVLKNVSNIHLSFFIIITITLCVLFFYFFKTSCFFKENSNDNKFSIIFGLALSMILARGSISQIALNQSFAFISSDLFIGNAILNPTWNAANVFFENFYYLESNQYKTMPLNLAYRYTEKLHKMDSFYTVSSIFDFSQDESPNVIMIVMEGVNNVCTQENMPFLSKLKNSSFSFENAMANGFRTEQGLIALLSAEPSLPFKSISESTIAMQQIPSIFAMFKQKGYATSFHFGGEIEFGNFKSYLKLKEIDSIFDIHSFPDYMKTQKLGVSDSFFFLEMKKKLKSQKKPFFNVLLTQSTHIPYDIELNEAVHNEKDKYLRAVSYLDRQIESFILNFEKTKMSSNTIFVICSDHSNALPNNYHFNQRERFQIPFIIYSKKLKSDYKGHKANEVFSQVDFVASFIPMILKGENTSKFPFSKCYFNNQLSKFAFSTFVNGNCMIEKNTLYEHDHRFPMPKDSNYIKNHIKGMAIMQVLAERFRGNIKNAGIK